MIIYFLFKILYLILKNIICVTYILICYLRKQNNIYKNENEYLI